MDHLEINILETKNNKNNDAGSKVSYHSPVSDETIHHLGILAKLELSMEEKEQAIITRIEQ